MNLRLLKLVSGELIIAGVEEGIDDEHDVTYTLHTPMEVHIIPEGLALLPVGHGLADKPEKITVRTDHAMYCLVPNNDVMNHYNKVTGKIVTPPTNIITP